MIFDRVLDDLKNKKQRRIDGKVNAIPFPFKRFGKVLPGIEQAKYYQSLVSLSSEQVNSINKSLNKDKNFDLMKSFIIGVLSSLFVVLLSRSKIIKNLLEGRRKKDIK